MHRLFSINHQQSRWYRENTALDLFLAHHGQGPQLSGRSWTILQAFQSCSDVVHAQP